MPEKTQRIPQKYFGTITLLWMDFEQNIEIWCVKIKDKLFRAKKEQFDQIRLLGHSEKFSSFQFLNFSGVIFHSAQEFKLHFLDSPNPPSLIPGLKSFNFSQNITDFCWIRLNQVVKW